MTVERGEGASDEIVPAALADLEDRYNNHLLCLDASDPVASVCSSSARRAASKAAFISVIASGSALGTEMRAN